MNRFELGTVDIMDGGCIRRDIADMSTVADRRDSDQCPLCWPRHYGYLMTPQPSHYFLSSPLCQWSAGCLCPRVPTLAAITISEPPSPGSWTWHSDHIALSIYTGQTFKYPNWKQKHCVSTKHTATTSTAILKEFDKPAGFQRDNDYYHHDPHNHVSII